MSDRLTPLTVIYGPFLKEGSSHGLEVMSISNGNGLVDENQLEQLFIDLIGHAPEALSDGKIGPFDDLESVQKYCFNVCTAFGNSGVSLVPLEKFNQLLIESYKSEELRGKLEVEGNFIKNPDAHKTGFFNKIFN